MQSKNTLRLMAAAISSAMLFGFAHQAFADTTDDLLDALIAKGVLTEEEGALLQKGRVTEKKKKNSEIKANFKDGIVFESGDGQHSMQVEGRLHFDYHSVDGYGTQNDPDTSTIADNFEIRRARIGVKGKFYNDYTYEIQTNMVGGTSNLVDQAWVNVGWWKEAQFKFGRYKAPFNLEKMTSSNNSDFNERSYVNQVAPNEVLGAMVWGTPMDGVIYQANVFQKDFSEADNATNDLFVGGRLAADIAKIAGWSNSVVHFGVSAYDGEWSTKPTTTSQNSVSPTTRSTIFGLRTEGRGLANIFRFQVSGEDALATPGGTATTTVDVQQDAHALEFAAARGPVKIQSEWARAHYDASNAATSARVSGDFDTWYAEALWLVTGESYADTYKEGAWGAIKPKNEFVHPSAIAAGNYGAWELGVRYSEYDASDITVKTAGKGSRLQGSPKGHAYTAGIKWILNPNVRFLFDYTRTKYETAFSPIDTTLPTTDHENALTLRGQLSF